MMLMFKIKLLILSRSPKTRIQNNDRQKTLEKHVVKELLKMNMRPSPPSSVNSNVNLERLPIHSVILIKRARKQLLQGAETPRSEQQSLRSVSFEGVAKGGRPYSLAANNFGVASLPSVLLVRTLLAYPARGSA